MQNDTWEIEITKIASDIYRFNSVNIPENDFSYNEAILFYIGVVMDKKARIGANTLQSPNRFIHFLTSPILGFGRSSLI